MLELRISSQAYSVSGSAAVHIAIEVELRFIFDMLCYTRTDINSDGF